MKLKLLPKFILSLGILGAMLTIAALKKWEMIRLIRLLMERIFCT